jgi:hypothetical protein
VESGKLNLVNSPNVVAAGKPSTAARLVNPGPGLMVIVGGVLNVMPLSLLKIQHPLHHCPHINNPHLRLNKTYQHQQQQQQQHLHKRQQQQMHQYHYHNN